MQTASAQPLGRLTPVSPPPPPGKKFIILGGPAPDISGLKLLNLEGAIGADCDGVLLLKHIDVSELAEVLARAPDPTMPIADFFNNHSVRRDFIGSLLNDESVKEMQQIFAPIWRRLGEFPFRAQTQDRTGMGILRLVYSRDTAAKATFDPRYPLTVQYPLVGTGPGIRQHLEVLADHDLLHRSHFTRTHACGKCGSARLNVYEGCPACGSADLFEEVLVHHYRCGCQEIESRFIQGDLLVCPKCRRELRHLGVDYGKPGRIVACRACGAVNSTPNANFICLDCSAVTPAETAATTDWYHYDLTDMGLSALREGRLPQSEFTPTLEQTPRAYSPREFQLLAMQETRVARQYRQAFSVARISFPNLETIRRELGILAADAIFRRAVDTIVETVRPRDFVGTSSSQSVIIGLPGISAAGVSRIEGRIRQTVRDTIETPLELTVEVAEGDAIAQLFARR
jgi:hypothetical protein